MSGTKFIKSLILMNEIVKVGEGYVMNMNEMSTHVFNLRILD